MLAMLRHGLLACASLLFVACGPPAVHPEPGKLTVAFTPEPPSIPELTLSSATLVIDHLQPIGNGPPPMPPPPMPLMIDVLSTAPVARIFDPIPPGVYSRVIFSVDNRNGPAVNLQGTWRGTPFVARLGAFGGNPVDVRGTVGAEIEPGRDATLSVQIDVGSWFAGNLLDQATASNGQITCDMMNNPQVAGALLMRVDQSFSLP
jgi:hypothetical protein